MIGVLCCDVTGHQSERRVMLCRDWTSKWSVYYVLPWLAINWLVCYVLPWLAINWSVCYVLPWLAINWSVCYVLPWLAINWSVYYVLPWCMAFYIDFGIGNQNNRCVMFCRGVWRFTLTSALAIKIIGVLCSAVRCGIIHLSNSDQICRCHNMFRCGLRP